MTSSTLQQQAEWLINQEPDQPKRDLLTQMLKPAFTSCTQVTALKRLVSTNGTRFFKQPDPNHEFHAIDDIQRDYRMFDDWYFFSGVVSTSNRKTFGFTVMFFSDPIGGDEKNAVDYACESAMMLFTSVNDQKIFESQIEHAPANSITRVRSPFAFIHPSNNFSIQATAPNPIFPMVVTANDTTNNITLTLTLTPQWDETKPLFQGTDKGFVGGAGMGYRYYSYANLAAIGTVNYGGSALPVTGVAWMDHQNGTVGYIPSLPWRFLADMTQLFRPPAQTTTGWNWFAVMLDNNMSMATSFPRAYDKDGKQILVSSAAASYCSLQLPDGSSRPMKGSLSIGVEYASPGYVVAAHFTGNDADLGAIDLWSRSLIPGTPSNGLLPPMIPFAETPAAVTGTVGGVARVGFGMLESVGVANRDDLLANILRLANLPASPQNIQTLAFADFRTSQKQGWKYLSLIGIVVLLIIFFRVQSTKRVSLTPVPPF